MRRWRYTFNRQEYWTWLDFCCDKQEPVPYARRGEANEYGVFYRERKPGKKIGVHWEYHYDREKPPEPDHVALWEMDASGPWDYRTKDNGKEYTSSKRMAHLRILRQRRGWSLNWVVRREKATWGWRR